jgi:hypothetical protein
MMPDLEAFDEFYGFFEETITSYDDPDDPKALKKFIDKVRQDIFDAGDHSYITADILATSLYRMIRLRENHFYSDLVNESEIAEWPTIRKSIDVHQAAAPLIKKLEQAKPDLITIAVLCCLRYEEED